MYCNALAISLPFWQKKGRSQSMMRNTDPLTVVTKVFYAFRIIAKVHIILDRVNFGPRSDLLSYSYP